MSSIAEASIMLPQEHIIAGQLSFDELMAGQQETRSVFDSIRSSKLGRAVAKIAVIAGFAGGTGLASAAPTFAEGTQQSVVAHEASAQNDWTNYGGDPEFAGGVHTRNQFVTDVLSAKGQLSLRYMGLNSGQIQAIDLGVREGKEQLKHFAFGTHFEKMAYGIDGVVVDNNGADFEDPRYPGGFEGYKLTVDDVTHRDVKRKVDGKMVEEEETINNYVQLVLPTGCGNESVQNMWSTETYKPISLRVPPQTPVVPGPTQNTVPPAECAGNTTNSSSGINAEGGNCSTNNVIICSNVNSPNSGGNCGQSTPPPESTPPLQPPTQLYWETDVEPIADGGQAQECVEVTAATNPATDQPDSVVTTFTESGTSEVSLSPTYQPSPATTPEGAQLECTEITQTDDLEPQATFVLTAKTEDTVNGTFAAPIGITLTTQPTNF